MPYLEALPAVAYTRSHMADYLVAAKLAKSRQKSFKTHLTKGGKVYVPPNWCTVQEAISAIQASGGIAVLAHPGRYPLNKRKLSTFVEVFAAMGGDGLEASYPNIDPNMKTLLEALDLQHHLYLSGDQIFTIQQHIGPTSVRYLV